MLAQIKTMEQKLKVAEQMASQQFKYTWKNAQWNTTDDVQLSADGLNALNTADDYAAVRAQQPVSLELLASLPDQKLVYWEVQVKNLAGVPWIGWVEPNVPLDDEWSIKHPGSYGVDGNGFYWHLLEKNSGNTEGLKFASDDFVGTGLLLTQDGDLKLFFTKNGRMNADCEPTSVTNQDLLLYPVVCFGQKDASIEANFGADLGTKPFKFDIDTHEAQLFVEE